MNSQSRRVRLGIVGCGNGPEAKRATPYHFTGMQADHGSGLPNQAFGRGSDLAVFAIAGPGVRADYRRANPIRLTDIAPTLCHLLGVEGPIGAEGAILWDCLATDQAAGQVS
jgi:arylsulfatase A-like enzyme